MDRHRDILFLYLTSHGSRNARFSLWLPDVPMTDLDGATLESILNESGIENQVVVISACFSGGFIGPLQDDHRLIITAAASDRTSFGCSNEADYTYFGRAYFHDALDVTHSFIAAFDYAAKLVYQRETAAEFIPSRPQISAGPAIRPILEDYRRQLDAQLGTCRHQDARAGCL